MSKPKPIPGEGCFTDADVERIIRETPYTHNPGNPMLSRGTDMCQCPTCKDYFNSTFAFTLHRVGEVGTPQRRCLTVAELLNRRWRRGPKGHWLTPRSAADWPDRLRQD